MLLRSEDAAESGLHNNEIYTCGWCDSAFKYKSAETHSCFKVFDTDFGLLKTKAKFVYPAVSGKVLYYR